MDPLVLRRAALLSFLAEWATENGVALLAATPDAAPEPDLRCALVVLNLGGLSARDPQATGWLAELAQLMPGAPVAVLSDVDATEEVVAALRGGARGFLPTSTEPEIALHALTFIMRGGSYFPPGAMLNRGPNAGSRGGHGGGLQLARDMATRHRPAGVSEKEEAILWHLRDGLSNKEIGRLLGMPESTVKVHVRRLLRRFGVANRTQAALAVREAPCGAPEHLPLREPAKPGLAFRLEVVPQQDSRRVAPPGDDRPAKSVA
ncbi:LuxR C-terminal-related transcriptional regulator [Falsiroseomonas sp.]|uniref:LuxR C-terminal-related transcriptional regulator n=1 Tax=Falsiroseomonas sp. TaxID=2870721 RepID=UPI00356516E1